MAVWKHLSPCSSCTTCFNSSKTPKTSLLTVRNESLPAKKKIAAAGQICVAQKEQIQSLRKATDQKSLNLNSREADILKLNGRLNEASSNKEYDIITGQVETAKSTNEQLEDEILTLMGQVDEAGTVLASAEQEVGEFTQRCNDVEAEVEKNEPGIREDIARLNSEISEAEMAIPPGEVRDGYERMPDFN